LEQISVIVAGGSGKRMNSEIPKQFLLLNGDPVLMRTIKVFHEYNAEMKLIIALPGEHISYWKKLCKKYNFEIPHQLVKGGQTRHQTVKNAIVNIKPGSLVAIHDGVRPLVSIPLIRTCFDTAAVLGNAIPVTELSESIRQLKGENNISADRSLYRLVQTPQVFQSAQLIDAFSQNKKSGFTDEASLVESAGYRIHLVNGFSENIKLTTSLDMCFASAILENC
jgi:2-C-methyl-D-erythritol 4-phosphate cytidylyltransferase